MSGSSLSVKLIGDQKRRLLYNRPTIDCVNERKILVMKLNNVILGGLISVGLLTIGANSAFAGGHFSAGNPGGLRAPLGYHMAPTPANQAWEGNNAWANYRAQNVQVQAPKVSTGTSGSAAQNNAVTP
jgi:hypothetical protein